MQRSGHGPSWNGASLTLEALPLDPALGRGLDCVGTTHACTASGLAEVAKGLGVFAADAAPLPALCGWRDIRC